MGFDVIYLPPIHPIGEVNRKGPNNTLTPGPDDPGSTWAIGSKDGGHDAIHPDLGTIEDFDAFVDPRQAARPRGRPRPGPPVRARPSVGDEHPEWFTTRADGTIAYAENPPKKYQDIYPLNFDNDFDGLCHEVLRVVRYWMDHGVRIFRVDNPHTKPVMFWEWLLARGPPDRPRRDLPVRGVHPPGDDARPRHGRLPPVLHVLHVAQRASGSSRSTSHELSHETVRRRCGRTCSSTPPTSSPSTSSTAARPRSGSAPPSRRRRRRRGACTPASSSTSTSRSSRAREEYLDSEKYQFRPRDWEARGAARAGPWRRTSPSSTRSVARTRRCSSCAT